MPDILLEKELTAKCLIKTCLKIEELIVLAAMAKYSLTRIKVPIVVVAVNDKWFFHSMICLEPIVANDQCKVLLRKCIFLSQGGTVHLESPAYFYSLSSYTECLWISL